MNLTRSADEDGEHIVLTGHSWNTGLHDAKVFREWNDLSLKLDIYSFRVQMEMLKGKEVSSLYKVLTDLSNALGPTLQEKNEGANFHGSFAGRYLSGRSRNFCDQAGR